MAKANRGGRPIKVTPRKIESFVRAWEELQACEDFEEVVRARDRAALGRARDVAEKLATTMREAPQ